MKSKLAILAAMGMMASTSGLAGIMPPPYIGTNGAADRKARGPQSQEDFDALAKAEAKRERKATIRRNLAKKS